MFKSLSLLEFVIAVMTVYRLAQLLAMDDGPYGIFDRWRKFLGRQVAQDQQEDRWTLWRNMAELFYCPYCLGIWFAAGAAILLAKSPVEFVLLAFGIAGAQAFLEGITPDVE